MAPIGQPGPYNRQSTKGNQKEAEGDVKPEEEEEEEGEVVHDVKGNTRVFNGLEW